MSQIQSNDIITFGDDTPAEASEVNSNFTAVKNAHNDTDSRVQALEDSTTDNLLKSDGSVVSTAPQKYKKITITNATNATPILVTSAAHGLVTGNDILIKDVLGNLAANGSFTITVKTVDTFELNNSIGNGAYASGGTGYLQPKNLEDVTTIGYMKNYIPSNDISFLVRQFIEFNDKYKIRVKKGTSITLTNASIDTRYFKIDADTDYDITTLLDTGSTLTAGKDYFIYLVPSGAGVALKISLNSTYPTGFTASNSRKIGGFHTLCADVTSANAPYATHPLIGFSAGSILPASVWCLKHKPNSSVGGLVYDKNTARWTSIYFQSGIYNVATGVLTTAFVYGGTVTDTRPWNDHAEDLFRIGLRLPTISEFISFAEGSNQRTNIYGSVAPTPKTAGGHLDTAGKRMVSDIGCEECCGYLYTWIDNPSANGSSGWANVDSIGTKGQLYGSSLALGAGGDWGGAAACGSRSSSAVSARSTAFANVGGRGVCESSRD